MNVNHAPLLAEILKAYDYIDELRQLAEDCAVSIDAQSMHGYDRSGEALEIARQLCKQVAYGNTQALLLMALETLKLRNTTGRLTSQWEMRQFHEELAGPIGTLLEAVGKSGNPDELAVPEASPFTAKSEVRDFLAVATTEMLVVDACIGVGTLDCLRDLKQPIRLLTGSTPNAIEKGFDSAVADFKAEGRVIEVRKGTLLHDRFVALMEDVGW